MAALPWVGVQKARTLTDMVSANATSQREGTTACEEDPAHRKQGLNFQLQGLKGSVRESFSQVSPLSSLRGVTHKCIQPLSQSLKREVSTTVGHVYTTEDLREDTLTQADANQRQQPRTSLSAYPASEQSGSSFQHRAVNKGVSTTAKVASVLPTILDQRQLSSSGHIDNASHIPETSLSHLPSALVKFDSVPARTMGVLSTDGRPVLHKSHSVAYGADSMLQDDFSPSLQTSLPSTDLTNKTFESSFSSPFSCPLTPTFVSPTTHSVQSLISNQTSLPQCGESQTEFHEPETEIRVLRRSESVSVDPSPRMASKSVKPGRRLSKEGWRQMRTHRRPSDQPVCLASRKTDRKIRRRSSESTSKPRPVEGKSSLGRPETVGPLGMRRREISDEEDTMEVSPGGQDRFSTATRFVFPTQNTVTPKTDSERDMHSSIETDSKMDIDYSNKHRSTDHDSFTFKKASTRSVPPPLRRQLSRRRSYQQATTPDPLSPKSPATEADDSGRGDSVKEEEEEEGLSTTPPGSPSAKSRGIDMSFDPYQIFEVQHLPCMILRVTVLRGRNITNGWAQDLIDTPDPYVVLRLKTAPEGRQRTHHVDNDCNPVWNKTFYFFINFSETHILEITLMEANPLNFDQTIGTVYFNLDRIREFDRPQLEVFNFNGEIVCQKFRFVVKRFIQETPIGVPSGKTNRVSGYDRQTSEVECEFHLEWDQNPTLRYSLCLSDKEKEFMRKRKEKVFEGLRKLLGDLGPRNAEEAPTIAVLGSGGGFRAMTGYSGVFKALADSGILDCATYACGLSGSSWYLSTLYSHPRWPHMNPGDLKDELKHNIDKSLLRLLGPNSVLRYLDSVLKKRREGQPISFTDFFGHMVGETLLKGRLDSRLTDQRAKIHDAEVPMPLYTCVHVKKDVPARSFQEWVEFSPYEIGMPKYGTFMDSELFGSKFFMGKLVRQYEEQPLHFLQGIWGSAFCILFKRLLEDNRRIDPAEMIRQEMGKQLEKTQDNDDDSSDLSDEDDDDEDDTESEKSDMDDDSKEGKWREERRLSGSRSPKTPKPRSRSEGSGEGELKDRRRESTESSGTTDSESSFVDLGPPRSFLAVDHDSSDSTGFEDLLTPKAFTDEGELKEFAAFKPSLSNSNTTNTENGQLPSSPKKGVRFSRGVDSYERKKERKQQKQKQGQRPALKRMPTARRGKSRSYWNSMLRGIFENQNFELLSTRAGRAAVIHNFMRGLSLQQTYPLSPFTPVHERVQEGDEFDGIFEMHPTHIKHIYMVDAGLTFNSPYPLVLRPQRGVDVILSFDFSARPSDSTPPFKELLLAERWAKLNRLPFPPIDPKIVDREGLKELYVFRDPKDPHCPVVLHFCLVNIDFRKYKAPGVRRETKEEFSFADFDIFDDPTTPYSTFNFTYTHEQFERLSQLMEFNTLNSISKVKEVLAEVIAKKREATPRKPIHTRDVKLLRMKSVQERRQLKKFLKKMESRVSSKTPTPTNSQPPTPFFTPTISTPTKQRNPFVFHSSSSGSNSSGSGSSVTGSKSSSPEDSNPFFRSLRKSSASRSGSSSAGSRSGGSGSGSSGSLEDSNPFFKNLKQDSLKKHRNGDVHEQPERNGEVQSGSDKMNKDNTNSQRGFLRNGTTEFSQQTSCEFQPHSNSYFSGYSPDGSEDVFDGISEPTHASMGGFGTSIEKDQTSNKLSSQNHTTAGDTTRQESGQFDNFRLPSSPAFDRVRQDPHDSCTSSDDEFHDAAEAITRDGETVTDSKLAKMHYEGAKQRRKMLRRQSTISSLNSITESISLDAGDEEGAQRMSSSSQPEGIEVADLDEFEGIAQDGSEFVDDHWFESSADSRHRGSVVEATSEVNR